MIFWELFQNYMKKSYSWHVGSSSSGYGGVQEDFGYGTVHSRLSELHLSEPRLSKHPYICDV